MKVLNLLTLEMTGDSRIAVLGEGFVPRNKARHLSPKVTQDHKRQHQYITVKTLDKLL